MSVAWAQSSTSAPLTATTEPAYFAMVFSDYNSHIVPGVVVGVNVKGSTFIVGTLQQAIYRGQSGKVDFEIWQHFAQGRRVGLWGGAGVGASINSTATTTPGSVTFEAAMSFRVARWLTIVPGIRGLVPLTGQTGLQTDKFVGLVYEWFNK
jgi:hypothetical protein